MVTGSLNNGVFEEDAENPVSFSILTLYVKSEMSGLHDCDLLGGCADGIHVVGRYHLTREETPLLASTND